MATAKRLARQSRAKNQAQHQLLSETGVFCSILLHISFLHASWLVFDVVGQKSFTMVEHSCPLFRLTIILNSFLQCILAADTEIKDVKAPNLQKIKGSKTPTDPKKDTLLNLVFGRFSTFEPKKDAFLV